MRRSRRVAAIGYAIVVAAVAACSPPELDSSANAISASPDGGPSDPDIGELAPPSDPFGIADLKTFELDTEIGALKDGRSFHDLEPNERARYRALARRRAERRSHVSVENRTPSPGVYAGDPATSPVEVQP